MQATIVIIEDEPQIAEFLQEVVTDEGFLVYTETTGTQGLKRVDQVSPELVLLDLNLPDIDGRSICEKIKSKNPATSVIMVTSQDTPTEIASGLNLGADDYIPKPVNPNVLVARIKARLRKADLGATQLEVDDLNLNQETHEVYRAGQSIDLSPQEYKMLAYFMANENRVLSRDMILSRIWQGNPDIETRVVDVYVGYLRKKIDFKEPKLLHSVRGFGYVMKVDRKE